MRKSKEGKKNKNANDEGSHQRKRNYMSKKLIVNLLSLLFSIISILYSFIWGVIFCIYTEKKGPYPKCCKALKNWCRVLYAFLLLACTLSIACTIVQSAGKSESKGFRILDTFKNLISFVANFVMLIGITVMFFVGDEYPKCSPLRKVTKVYIIFEWCIIGFVVVVVILLVVVSLIRKKIKKLNQSYVYKDEETAL